ncbi:ABC transporter substrate-binding protein [Loktanella sp. M215]|uniref:ABC transporter substrate-binding protein n=1 Tax=Loktanella sp. M215 TaxID=2675431 RepID=UPI001F166F80|nr:ABC transporter substrate-binding protein [Loktanella sp. M215]MCF7698267.1 ABC transporter substrate-binding protein [Loktanella sp. M215]
MRQGAICCALALSALGHPALADVTYRAAVIRVDAPGPLPISRLDLPPKDLGFAGAALATDDNMTTGAFTGQTFETVTVVATPDTVQADMAKLLDDGISFIVTLADAATTVALADQAGDRALLINAAATDDSLRGADCRANLLHVTPSDAMRADALAQYLIWKRWGAWYLIAGSHPEDIALAEAYKRAATKFGAEIVEERTYEDTGGARRTDTGHVLVQAQIPVFTQRAPDHDVMIAADHTGVFADYLPYHTWDARPVAGSAGLIPTSWTPAMEAWGATQWQNRFEEGARRLAQEEDFETWVALRVLGEAATRTNGGDAAAIRDFIMSGRFELGAFKGQKLTFRDWDGQLRQPVLLAADNVIVSVSPQDGFLHQTSTLDTLGIDRTETECRK